MNFGYFTTFQSMDKGIIERFGPTGFTSNTFSLSLNYTGINSGNLFHTAFIFLTFATFLTVFFVLGFFELIVSLNSFFMLLFASYLIVLLLD